VQDQPVVRVAPEGLRDDLLQLRLDFVDRLARREPRAIADPENVGVDCKGLLAERRVEHHVGGLAAHARQRLELFSGARHLAVVMIDQRLAEQDDVLRLGVE